MRPEVDIMGDQGSRPTMKGEQEDRQEIGRDDSIEGQELEAESGLPVTTESQDNIQSIGSEYTKANIKPQNVFLLMQSLD